MIKDVKSFCSQTFVFTFCVTNIFHLTVFSYRMSSRVMLKRKRTSCVMLRYTLCSLYRICCFMPECRLYFQVLPFLIHSTCSSCANVHLVSKQAQRSTPWMYHGRFYTYTFSKISKIVAKNACNLTSLCCY